MRGRLSHLGDRPHRQDRYVWLRPQSGLPCLRLGEALRQALQTEISYRVGRGHELSVFDQIVHLNDQHRWSRERIAEWLDTLPAVGDLGRETLLAAQAA